MAAVVNDRVIAGPGTFEAAWQAWPGLHALKYCNVDEVVPRGMRAVVVSPHPDDEVLASGGMLAMLAAHDTAIQVVAVTDGEASHPGSDLWPPVRLGERRRAEGRLGLERLGLVNHTPVNLSIPDGQVNQHLVALTDGLLDILKPKDIVFSTWELDGHPDHDATARAVAAACAMTGLRHVQTPVWMWHWAAPGDLRVPWDRMRRVPLSAYALGRKSSAIRAHATQLSVQDTGAPPILPGTALQRLVRPFEYIIVPPGG